MIKIKLGYELIYDCPVPTPMLLVLNVHSSRVSDLVTPDHITTEPAVPISSYRDSFGNWCARIVAPAGRLRIFTTGIMRDSGLPDPVVPNAIQHPVEDLPEEALQFLLGSRYCETDQLSATAWSLFGPGAPHNAKTGWGMVQSICDYVNGHITFDYQQARPTRTAFDAYNERVGVCRDFAHLAVAFTRCMNIPARYCTGYLGDVGLPPPYGVMDFAGWFEAYIGGQWYTFDPRNNVPRIGRVLIARGRDATDVAITTNFGTAWLASFTVVCDEVVAA